MQQFDTERRTIVVKIPRSHLFLYQCSSTADIYLYVHTYIHTHAKAQRKLYIASTALASPRTKIKRRLTPFAPFKSLCVCCFSITIGKERWSGSCGECCRRRNCPRLTISEDASAVFRGPGLPGPFPIQFN